MKPADVTRGLVEAVRGHLDDLDSLNQMARLVRALRAYDGAGDVGVEDIAITIWDSTRDFAGSNWTNNWPGAKPGQGYPKEPTRNKMRDAARAVLRRLGEDDDA